MGFSRGIGWVSNSDTEICPGFDVYISLLILEKGNCSLWCSKGLHFSVMILGSSGLGVFKYVEMLSYSPFDSHFRHTSLSHSSFPLSSASVPSKTGQGIEIHLSAKRQLISSFDFCCYAMNV